MATIEFGDFDNLVKMVKIIVVVMKQYQKITLAARVDDDALWALYFSLLYIITIRVASEIN